MPSYPCYRIHKNQLGQYYFALYGHQAQALLKGQACTTAAQCRQHIAQAQKLGALPAQYTRHIQQDYTYGYTLQGAKQQPLAGLQGIASATQREALIEQCLALAGSAVVA